MSVINTNIMAMVGRLHLNRSSNALQTAMERLSSGLRINSAKDDAAGQAIANRMTAQLRGFSQAQRNANDGISLAQTAEGALRQVNDNLQRIRELSVQAANGTMTASDLDSIQAEMDQRLDEIDRIAAQTQFTGIKVLNHGHPIQIQVGANDGETVAIPLTRIHRDSLGLSGFRVSPLTREEADNILLNAVDGDSLTIGEDNYVLGPGGWSADGGNNELDASDLAARIVTHGGPITATIGGETVRHGPTSNPMATLDSALNQVDRARGNLGALQNRFESTITTLQINQTNLAAARSRIMDTDYAVEVANMIRAQILYQAGIAILAQANQIPRTVLTLLQR